MNRKGDIPTTLLIVIALALMLITWMAFLNSETGFKEKSAELSKLNNQIEFNEQYMRAMAEVIALDAIRSGGDLDEDLKSSALEHYQGIDSEGNLFGKIRNGEFSFSESEGEYVLKIDGLLAQAKVGNNQIKRNFDLTINLH